MNGDLEGRNKGLTYLMMSSVLWGLSFPAIKYGLNNGLNNGWLVLLRFPLAAITIILILILLRGRRALPRALFSREVWMVGAFNGLAFAVQYHALLHTSATHSSLLINMNVVFVAILGLLILKEKIDRYIMTSITLALTGVFLLNIGGSSASSGSSLYGDSLVVIAAFLWAFYMIKNKSVINKGGDPLEVVTGVILVTFIVASPFAFYWLSMGGGIAPFPSDKAVLYWMIILYTALGGSIGAYFLYTTGVRYVSATISSVFIMFQVVFAVTTSYLLLGERLGSLGVLGAILICLAVLIVSLRVSKGHVGTANDK